MYAIVVTLAVFQPLMSALNLELPENALDMLVTSDTFQPGIAPYSLAEHIPSAGLASKHVAMAARKLSSVMGVVLLLHTALVLQDPPTGMRPGVVTASY